MTDRGARILPIPLARPRVENGKMTLPNHMSTASNISAPQKVTRTSEHDFPALFTIENSLRHEILLINPAIDLPSLTSQIEHLLATSPNAGDFLGKYRSKDVTETVKEIGIKWASEGRDSRIFVRETLVTEGNLEAMLRMMAVGVGKDVLDVKIKVHEKEKKAEEERNAEEKKPAEEKKVKR